MGSRGIEIAGGHAGPPLRQVYFFTVSQLRGERTGRIVTFQNLCSVGKDFLLPVSSVPGAEYGVQALAWLGRQLASLKAGLHTPLPVLNFDADRNQIYRSVVTMLR